MILGYKIMLKKLTWFSKKIDLDLFCFFRLSTLFLFFDILKFFFWIFFFPFFAGSSLFKPFCHVLNLSCGRSRCVWGRVGGSRHWGHPSGRRGVPHNFHFLFVHFPRGKMFILPHFHQLLGVVHLSPLPFVTLSRIYLLPLQSFSWTHHWWVRVETATSPTRVRVRR